MDKLKVVNEVLDREAPQFICPVEKCNETFYSVHDFENHLELDHTTKELLDMFKWDIEDEEIVIEEEHTPKQKLGSKLKELKNLDELMCVDDSNKDRREIAQHLTKYLLGSKMIPNVGETRYYNIMSHSKHIATVDCWDLKEDKLLWGFIVLHDGGKASKIEREIDWVIDNKMEEGKRDRLEIAEEIAKRKYGEC